MSAGAALLFAPALIRQIGLENYGTWAFVTSLATFAGIVDIGISRAITYYIIRANNSEKEARQLYTGLCMLLSIASALILAAILLETIGNSEEAPPEKTGRVEFISTIAYGLLIIGATLPTNLFRGFLEARLKIHITQCLTLAFSILNYGSVYIASLFCNDVWILVKITCSVHFLMLLIYASVSMRQNMPRWRRPKYKIALLILGRGQGYLLLAIASISILPINRALLLYIGGGHAHAIFDIALKVAMAATMLLQTVNAPLFALLATYQKTDPNKIQAITKRMTLITLAIYLIGMIVLAIASNTIAGIMIPDQQKILQIAILIMAGGVSFSGVAEPTMRAAWARGEERMTASIRILALALNVLMIIPFMDFPPVIAVSTAYGASILLGSVLQIAITLRSAPVHPKKPT